MYYLVKVIRFLSWCLVCYLSLFSIFIIYQRFNLIINPGFIIFICAFLVLFFLKPIEKETGLPIEINKKKLVFRTFLLIILGTVFGPIINMLLIILWGSLLTWLGFNFYL